MACQSATLELRGEADVSDELAHADAAHLYRFLQRRGFVAGDPGLLPLLLRPESPLTGVDMIEAEKPGIVVWKVKVGDEVKRGDLIGEIVDIADVDAPRSSIVARTDGLVFAMRSHKLVRPGQVILKVSGLKPLEWRKGEVNLLTT